MDGAEAEKALEPIFVLTRGTLRSPRDEDLSLLRVEADSSIEARYTFSYWKPVERPQQWGHMRETRRLVNYPCQAVLYSL